MNFTAYDTAEEMMNAIEAASTAADALVRPWQAAVKTGDHFVQTTGYDFLIFGIVMKTKESFYRTEQGRNFRFCKCYSVAVPDGEMGDVHVSQITKIISEHTFLKFQERGWIVEDGDTI